MPDIPTRQLGTTGLDVTVLGFGAMELRGKRGGSVGPEFTPEGADRVLNGVLDAGINYIDTSIDYGLSEENIGRFISHRRDEYFLASKCGCPVIPPPSPGERSPHTYTRENIVAGVEQSLRRMNTEYLDVVQFHSSPSKKVLEAEQAIETLLDLQSQGKIRFLGSSSTLPEITDLINMEVFNVFQIPYSAMLREHEEVISTAARSGAGTVIRGGVGRGAPGEVREREERPISRNNPDWDLFERAGLSELLDGQTKTAFMLRFTISHPDLSTTIVGSINPAHIAANVEAVKQGPLAPDIYEDAKNRISTAERAS